MSGAESIAALEAAKSTISALISAKERYEALEGIITDASSYRQRLSHLEGVLKTVKNVYSEALDILDAKNNERRELERGVRYCHDLIANINELLISIREKSHLPRPMQLYQASNCKAKLEKYHKDLDSAISRLQTTMISIGQRSANRIMYVDFRL